MSNFTPPTTHNIVDVSYRIGYVDILKGIAILLVVVGHVLAWTYSDWANSTKCNFIGTIAWNIIYSFHMPLFMFVSGYVVFNPSKKYYVFSIIKRILLYIIPFLFMGTVLYYYRKDPSGICNYWYLRALAEYVIVLYVLYLLYEKIQLKPQYKDIILAMVYVIIFKVLLWIIEEKSIADVIICKKHLNLYLYFITGWLVRRNRWIEDKILGGLWIFPLSLFSFYLYTVFGIYNSKVLAFSGILLIYSIARLVENSNISKTLICWGKNTMEIYILHFFFLFAAPCIGDYFLKITHLPTAITLQFSYGIIISGIIIYICILLAKIINRNKILSFLFFGKL